MDHCLRHLQWTLGFDWAGLSVGTKPERGELSGWRSGAWDKAWAHTKGFQNLRWPALKATQSLLLGRDARFRAGEAFCRERRYGIRPKLQQRFDQKIVADALEPIHPVSRGIRLYLDIIHIHPFDDGNARAALLWLSWTLLQADWPLPRPELLVPVPKPVGVDSVPRVMAALLSEQP